MIRNKHKLVIAKVGNKSKPELFAMDEAYIILQSVNEELKKNKGTNPPENRK